MYNESHKNEVIDKVKYIKKGKNKEVYQKGVSQEGEFGCCAQICYKCL